MESVAQFIVSKLGQLAVDKFKEIRGVGDKIVLLTDELSTMNAFLRMISEADQSAVDHLVREWEKQVGELAYDAEDCADTYWLRVVRRRMELQFPSVIVKWPKYQWEKLRVKHTLAADVKALLARAIAVSERRARYKIDQAALPRSPWFALVSGASASANALRRADDPDDQFVGIEEQVNTLAERIKAEDDDDTRLKVFSIVGFAGMGKTTLAVELCRHLDADFPRQALVSVSQAFDGAKDMKGLLTRVLKQMVKVKAEGREQTNGAVGTSTTITQGNQLRIDEIDEMDADQLSVQLKEQLTGKRYLIVIDDVWSLPAWEAIRVRLPENKCRSRIIVTTRMETVNKASSVSKDLVHHIKPLDLDDSKKLFIKRVFGSMGGTCPDGLKDTMDKILKKCGGLPLAIVSIAGLLGSYNSDESLDRWKMVSNSIGSLMESHPTLEGMRQVIALSYDCLPPHLKACMMYLSIFPEDYVIAKDRLLYRWIAEGLVAEEQGLTLFDVAEEYFNELISRNMIQPDKLPGHRSFFPEEMVEACRVHDMMHEVIVSKSRDANFVSLVGRQYGGLPHGKVRRLSIHGNDDNLSVHGNDDKHCSAKKNLQYIGSLTIFQFEGLHKLLGKFKLLRVLDLEDCFDLVDKHMRYVCQLYLLRLLRLTGIRITKVPREIGDLEYLESLDVESRKRYTMPPTITKLRRLERMRVYEWILPRGLGNMKALREVDGAVLKEGDIQVAEEIGDLQQLQVLYITVDGFEEEFSRALCSSLSKTRALRSLHLYGNRSLNFLRYVTSPPPLLRCLTMLGLISQSPDFISSLKLLTEFSVQDTYLACDKLLNSLCELPDLQIIRLGYGACKFEAKKELVSFEGEDQKFKDKVELVFFEGEDRELVAFTEHKLPRLRILDLNLRQARPEVVKFKKGSMPRLETLLLEFSYMDKSIVGIEELENLREVKLKGDKDNWLEHKVKQELENVRDVLLEHAGGAAEQNLDNVRRVLSQRAREQHLENLMDFLMDGAGELNLESLREVRSERAVQQTLDNFRKAMLKDKENKSLVLVLEQLQDMNKRPEKTNQIKVVVEYL